MVHMKVYDNPWQGYYSPLFLVIHDYVIHPSLKVDALSKRLSRLGSCLLLIRGLSSLSVTCSPTWNAPLHPGSIQQTQLRERLTRTSKDVGRPQHWVNWMHQVHRVFALVTSPKHKCTGRKNCALSRKKQCNHS